jgi:hypothetical protein
MNKDYELSEEDYESDGSDYESDESDENEISLKSPQEVKGSPEEVNRSPQEVPKEAKVSCMTQLTLELMVNRKHFKKILEKTDSKKFSEMSQHITMVKEASPMIISMTESLLANYIKFGSADNYNEDIKNIFEHYIENCLNHIKNEKNDKNDNYIHHKETDVIFESIDDNSTYFTKNIKNAWGKAINKSMY